MAKTVLALCYDCETFYSVEDAEAQHECGGLPAWVSAYGYGALPAWYLDVEDMTRCVHCHRPILDDQPCLKAKLGHERAVDYAQRTSGTRHA